MCRDHTQLSFMTVRNPSGGLQTNRGSIVALENRYRPSNVGVSGVWRRVLELPTGVSKQRWIVVASTMDVRQNGHRTQNPLTGRSELRSCSPR